MVHEFAANEIVNFFKNVIKTRKIILQFILKKIITRCKINMIALDKLNYMILYFFIIQKYQICHLNQHGGILE